MLRHTASPGVHAAVLAAAATFVVAGCGGTYSDKAGGAQKPEPTVLTMANGNGDSSELGPFAAAAARLSGGTLRIDFRNAWRGGAPDYETEVIGDVKAGKIDLGWAGSRAFASVGVPSFDALHAPLLIDSYPLERKTLESPLVGEMLDGLEPLGVVGLGILPGPLRKLFGVSRLVHERPPVEVERCRREAPEEPGDAGRGHERSDQAPLAPLPRNQPAAQLVRDSAERGQGWP